MAEGSENERDDLNAIGNPRVQVRSDEGGMPGEGYIGQVRPTGVMSRGTPDRALWNSRGGVNRGAERTPKARK